MSYVYLASPYTHPDPAVVEWRVHATRRATALLMMRGLVVFSPIAHTHDLVQFIGRQSHEFWMAQDIPMLRKAERLMVLCIDGWAESRGVMEEIELAQAAGIPVEYVNEDGRVSG